MTIPNSRDEKIKDSQSRIHLWDDSYVQFHRPLDKVDPLDLSKLIPPEFKSLPLEIEIGCGKGEFIANRSATFKDRFFIGIDRRMDRIKLTQNKVQKHPCLIVHEDARRFLAGGLPQNILALHLYHPDPWPKAKHHKHRFFRSPDALRWISSIRDGGFFYLSTDHREYFEEILDIIATWKPLLSSEIVFRKEHFHSAPKTHFESLFLKKKEPVFKAVFKKNAISPDELKAIFARYIQPRQPAQK
jgi:tRNA (guanine-N7-)-methyltransferase